MRYFDLKHYPGPFLLIFMGFLALMLPWAITRAENGTTLVVSEVLSGDMIKLETGAIVQYASVAAPSLLSASREIEKYAEESLAFNRSLTEGQRIKLEWGSRIRDERGHFLAYVYLDDGTFVNLKILEDGYAKLAIEPPNLEHAEELQTVARAARREGRGLWRYEAQRPRAKALYIGDKMKHVFHQPDCPLLDLVPEAHRISFDSRVQARSKKYEYCNVCKKELSQDTDLF